MAIPKNTFFRYLPISPADERWGLYVTTAGYIWSQPHQDYPLAHHPTGYNYLWDQGRILQEFQIVYVTRGEGVYESALAGKQPIKAGNAFMVFPGVWHRYGPTPEIGWDECWIGFDGAVARDLLSGGVFCPEKPVFSLGLGEFWQDTFYKAIELLEIEPFGYAQMLAAITFQILTRLHLSASMEKLSGEAHDMTIRKAKQLLMQRLAEKIDLAALARGLNISLSRLRHNFREHTGFSLYQYQLELRLSKAKTLLNSTNLRVKEVATQVGFDCPYHFSNLFKRKTGLSPGAWRHEARGGGWTEASGVEKPGKR